MAQQTVDSKVCEFGLVNGEPGLSIQEKQLPVAVKKTPLRDLQSENNIVVAQKVSGTKRPFPESQMSPSHHHSLSGNAANGRLVYVRRKSEAESGKNNHTEVIADNQEDGHQPKSSISESQMQCLHAYAPVPTTSLMSIPCGKPSIPVSMGNSDNKTVSEAPRAQSAPSAITLTVQPTVNKQNWEARYLQLQMFLKTLDQSSLEDHLQMLRSLSAVELSRHAVELEKRAIQLSLEQGKELQRVKALNVLGKSVKSPNEPLVQQQMPQT